MGDATESAREFRGIQIHATPDLRLPGLGHAPTQHR